MNNQITQGALNLSNLPQFVGRPDPVILDIGTNDGRHSRAFFDLFPYATVHSFEPDPRCIAKFKRNLALYPRAKLHELAIGASDCTAEFHASGGQNLADGIVMEGGWDASGSLRKPTGHIAENPGITFDTTYPVQVMKLDTWHRNSGLGLIDFIWADVQGAEVDLINGGIDTFTNHVKYFYTEYNDKELYEGQLNLSALLALLPSYSVVTQFTNDVLLRNNNIA